MITITNVGAPNAREEIDPEGLRDYEVRVYAPDGELVSATGTNHRRRNGWVHLVADAFDTVKWKLWPSGMPHPRDSRK